MGDFAPMNCPYCNACPYSGVTLGDRHDDPHARSRWYDCESFLHFNSDMEWAITEKCADRAQAFNRAEGERAATERYIEIIDTWIDTYLDDRVYGEVCADALRTVKAHIGRLPDAG